MKYIMRPVKQAAEAVGTWTEDNWDVKIVNSFYTMAPGKFMLKINIIFNSLSWLLFVRYFYTRGNYIIKELNEEQ